MFVPRSTAATLTCAGTTAARRPTAPVASSSASRRTAKRASVTRSRPSDCVELGRVGRSRGGLRGALAGVRELIELLAEVAAEALERPPALEDADAEESERRKHRERTHNQRRPDRPSPRKSL